MTDARMVDLDAVLRVVRNNSWRFFTELDCSNLAGIIAALPAIERTAQPVAAEEYKAFQQWREWFQADHAAPPAASEDAARLDWMEKELLRKASFRENGALKFQEVNAWSIASAGTDLRAAIDAARGAK
jgi:hypothetical protein